MTLKNWKTTLGGALLALGIGLREINTEAEYLKIIAVVMEVAGAFFLGRYSTDEKKETFSSIPGGGIKKP